MTDADEPAGTIEIRRLDITDIAEATRVLALQHASYRVEAELIGRNDIPPLHEEISDLQSSGETFFGAFVGCHLSGVVAYKVIGDTLDLHRVMVDPQFFRLGIARKLVAFVELFEPRALRSVVTTGRDNTPARRLYERMDYTQTGQHEVARGFWIVAFEKRRAI
jgi:ribosomal protein S18 acetylase RimI-like enzyme